MLNAAENSPLTGTHPLNIVLESTTVLDPVKALREANFVKVSKHSVAQRSGFV